MRLRLPVMSEHKGKRVLFARLVTEVECRKCLPRFREGMEIRCKRDARYLLRQIVCELLPIARRVQNAVNVVENHVLRDRVVAVMFMEGVQRRVRDVVNTIWHLFNTRKRVRYNGCVHWFLIPVPREALTIEY